MLKCLFVHGGYCLHPQCHRFEKSAVNDQGVYPNCETEETWKAKDSGGEFPSTPTQVLSFLKSLTSFAKSSKAEQIRRLSICAPCPLRKSNRCTLCGCFLTRKVKKADSKCGDGQWQQVAEGFDYRGGRVIPLADPYDNLP